MNNAIKPIDYDLFRERARRLRNEAIADMFLRAATKLRSLILEARGSRGYVTTRRFNLRFVDR